MSALILLGLLMTIGFIAGSFGDRAGLPRVALYVVAGMLFSKDLLGAAVPLNLSPWSEELTNIALGVIAFIIGSELNWEWIRNRGRSIMFGVLGQSLATVFLVSIGTWLVSMVFLPRPYQLQSAILLGIIASATAPAATVAIIEEYRSKGPLTSMLLSIVAIAYFTLAISLASAAFEMTTVLLSLWEIAGAIVVGGLLGGALGWYARRIHESELRLPIVLGFIFLLLGLARFLHFSTLLSCMVLGFISKLMFMHKAEKWLEPIKAIQESIFLIFFTLAGTHFQLHVFFGSFVFILTYILLRTAGKYGGGFAGARMGGAPPEVSQNVGLGLLPQAGVAIGLALRTREANLISGEESLILNTILGSTIVFELVSPFFAKLALTRAGEVGKQEK